MDMDGANLNDREFERIVDFVTGRLDQDESSALRAAADGDASLRGVIRRVERIITQLGRLTIDQVDQSLLNRLKRLYDPSRLVPRTVDQNWRDVIATLVEDTRQRDALAGFRGVAASYQLTFEADGVEIHLQITPDDDDESVVHVMGQIDSDRASGIEVRSMIGGDVVVSSSCDEHGYFTFTAGVGTYDLAILLDQRVVIVGAIEMG